MPNIFHQSIEDILRSATPEQKIIWNDIFLRFNERCSVSQFVYTGSPVTTELSVYTARKIYLAYSFLTGCVFVPSVTTIGMNLYNELNVLNNTLTTSYAYWDATAAAVRYVGFSKNYTNLLFSRIATAGVQFISFIGYRITY